MFVFLLKNSNFCYLWKHFKIKNENPAGWICFAGIQEQSCVSKWVVSEEWYGIVLYFLFMFWLSNFIRGVGWLCLGDREIEFCHARRKIYQGIVLQTCGSSPGLRGFFVICVAILDFFSPGAHHAGGDGARALLGCCSCSTPFLEAQAGIMTVQRSGGFYQLYFLWLAISPSQGNNSEIQQLLGQGPATGKDEGSLNHGSVGWKEFLEVKAELLFPMGGAIP